MTRIFAFITTVLTVLVGFIAFETYTPPSFLLERWQNNTPAITWSAGEEPGGLGTGWIYDLEKGLIITNHHVVDGAGDKYPIEVTFRTASQPLEATLVASAPNLDIAILRVNANALKNIKNLSELSITEAALGDNVYAIGHPHGLYGSLSLGVISYERRVSPTTPRQILVQTDTAINSGNSGGPLLNRYGQLIGVNVSILSKTGENNGLGFAVHPISLKKAIEELLEHGKTTRAVLGLGFDKNRDTVISEGGPAHKAGLRDKDFIVKLNDTIVNNNYENIIIFMAQHSVDDVIKITTRRGGEFNVILEAEKPVVENSTPNKPFTDEELVGVKEAFEGMVGVDIGGGIIESVDVNNNGVIMVITLVKELPDYEAHAKSGTCTGPIKYITDRVGITVIYKDKNGKTLKEVKVTESSCNSKA